jgi:hypothetical protein
MITPKSPQEKFETECRKLLKITGDEFRTRLAANDLTEFETDKVIYIMSILPTVLDDLDNVSTL